MTERVRKCWYLEAFGLGAYYTAHTAGEARTRLAYTLDECDYVASVGDGYKAISRCCRAPKLDEEAQQHKRSKCIGGTDIWGPWKGYNDSICS